jgi:uncharacterized repeat protein (TIGR03803 family)
MRLWTYLLVLYSHPKAELTSSFPTLLPEVCTMVRARLFPAQGIVFVPLFLFLVASVISAAASETVLHTFKDAPSGAFPQSNLIADAAGNLYGTTQYGGAYGYGAVFTLILDSTGKWNETVLYSFTGGSDGANPLAGLVFDAAGNLYGTTGGFGNCCILTEVVYRLSPNGNGKWTLTVIYTFQGPIDGALAAYSLVFDAAGNLYGAAYAGGASNFGTVFELSPAAQGPWTETTLYNFTDGFDGAYPFGPLIFDPAGNLYGTTIVGGDSNCNNFYPPIVGCGVIFELTKNGDGTWTETTVHAFNYADGAFPEGSLVRDASGDFYGTTYGGPDYQCPPQSEGCGTVYRLSFASGSWKLTTLYDFAGGPDGGNPVAGLVLGARGTLFGTTYSGGASPACPNADCGTVFELSPTTGTVWKEKILHLFSFPGGQGQRPAASLIFDQAGNLYGTASQGGAPCSYSYALGCGTVFKLSPRLKGPWAASALTNFPGLGDGLYPQAGFVADGAGHLYGTTSSGGSSGGGSVFEMSLNANGWTERVIHSFPQPYSKSVDGSGPFGSLIFDAQGNLYGTTESGGNTGCFCGVVFKLSSSANGIWQETVLYSFLGGGNDGAFPASTLTFDGGGNLYGTTMGGGVSRCQYNGGCGTVFKLSPISGGPWQETLLYRFRPYDGYNPAGQVVFDAAGNLYGATVYGGSFTGNCSLYGCGTIFELIPTASGPWTEKFLHLFQAGTDGALPSAVIFGPDGNLYGTTYVGGSTASTSYCPTVGCGTVFQLSPTSSGGWGKKVLHSFDPNAVPGDGLYPQAPPVFDAAGNLYGNSQGGDLSCIWNLGATCGIVFQLTPNTNGVWPETILHRFEFADGAVPQGQLVVDQSGNLFGTTLYGGTNNPNNRGVVFEISPGAEPNASAPRERPHLRPTTTMKPHTGFPGSRDAMGAVPRERIGQ